LPSPELLVSSEDKRSLPDVIRLLIVPGIRSGRDREREDGKARPVPVVPDERVRSLLLLNPATFWFVPGSLKEVEVPILIFAGENDRITLPAHAQTVAVGVFEPGSGRPEVIPRTGRFSLMSNFPLQMV
jgi:predicted dienelactone hydrolase